MVLLDQSIVPEHLTPTLLILVKKKMFHYLKIPNQKFEIKLFLFGGVFLEFAGGEKLKTFAPRPERLNWVSLHKLKCFLKKNVLFSK